MSFFGEVQILPLSSLNELDRLHKKVIGGNSFDELSNYISSVGEDLDCDYSGSVIFDLFNYLRDKKKIDLEKNEMSGFIMDFLDSIEDGIAVYSLFSAADKGRFLNSLNPDLYSEAEFQRYIDEEYKAFKGDYKGYGAYMKDTLVFIHENLNKLDDSHLLFIGVFY